MKLRRSRQSKISIHAPTRGATIAPRLTPIRSAFQSTLPREERPLLKGVLRCKCDFNPRSHERSDGAFIASATGTEDFNPRSHERSDRAGGREEIRSQKISIHAPTRGATINDDRSHRRRRISIHAPTRGATGTVTTVRVI